MLKSDRLSGSERAYYSRFLLLYFLYNILSVFTSTISDVRYRNKNTGKISGKHYSINIIGHTMLHAFCPSRDNGLSLGICQTSASAFFFLDHKCTWIMIYTKAQLDIKNIKYCFCYKTMASGHVINVLNMKWLFYHSFHSKEPWFSLSLSVFSEKRFLYFCVPLTLAGGGYPVSSLQMSLSLSDPMDFKYTLIDLLLPSYSFLSAGK